MIFTMSVYFADQFAILHIALVIVSVQINKFLTPDGWVKINLSQVKKENISNLISIPCIKIYSQG
jgi:hypothetical protein